MSAVIEVYFAQSIAAVLRSHSRDSNYLLPLVDKSFHCYSEYCAADEVSALAGVVVEAMVASLSALEPLPGEAMVAKGTLLLRAITVMCLAGERIQPHIDGIVAVLAYYYDQKSAPSSLTSVMREAIAALTLHPSPFVFTHTVSAFLHEFNKRHWLATDVIEHVLETLIYVACENHSYQSQLSSALLTHTCNTISDSSLYSSSSSRSCVFIPSLGRVKAKLSLGSEEVMRQFTNKCGILERQLAFVVTTLKFQNSFTSSCHPCQLLFENDIDNLLQVVIFCVTHENEGGGGARILQSELLEDVHKNSAAVRSLFCTQEESEGRSVPKLLHLSLECLHELIIGHGSIEFNCVSSLILDRLLRVLDLNDSALHSRSGSSLSQQIRVMLLFFLNAALHWIIFARNVVDNTHDSSRKSNTINSSTLKNNSSLLLSLTPLQLCQICVYARSEHRGTQHIAGCILQRLVAAEPMRKVPSKQPLLAEAVSRHSAMQSVQLLRNTIFNVLIQVCNKPGRHGLKTIMAWDLQKNMLQTYSTVEIFSALPMIYALESFWTVYESTDNTSEHELNIESDEDDETSQLKYEMLHNLVMFVCTFFRYVDNMLGLQGRLSSDMGVFSHLDRFGSTLLYENDSLHLKCIKRSVKMDYQTPNALVADDITSTLLGHGAVAAQVSEAERGHIRRQLAEASYKPVENPHKLLHVHHVDTSLSPPFPLEDGIESGARALSSPTRATNDEAEGVSQNSLVDLKIAGETKSLKVLLREARDLQ